MKGMKKLLSILVVLTLVLSLGASAMAAAASDLEMTGSTSSSVVVTLPEKYATHDMVAYRIFKGAQNTESEQDQLGVVEWADGVDSSGLLSALISEYGTSFTAGMNAVAVANAISNLAKDPDFDAVAFAKIVAGHVGTSSGVPFSKPTDGSKPTATLTSGYWVIVDNTTFDAVHPQPEGFAYSAYLLQVVGTEGEIPVTPKFAAPEVVKKVQEKNDTTGATAVWQDGADYDIGDDVPFKLEATMPSTLEGYTSYKLVFHDTLSAGLTSPKDFKFFVTSGGTTNEVTFTVAPNIVVNGDDTTTITITIDDVLASPFNAKAGDTITVEYKAQLGTDAVLGSAGNPNTVQLEYSNNPNDATGTGMTAKDTVKVFTFELDVNKVDEESNALPGAEFVLLKKVSAGTPSTQPDVTSWEGIGTMAQGEVFDYAGDLCMVCQKAVITDGTKFAFEGLDSGDYLLVETKVPEGYNRADDTAITIAATYETDSADPQLTGLTVTPNSFKPDTNNAIISGQIENQKGVELPETGGIGTTIFYVAGAILVAGALILLVTKKRVNGEEK